MRLKGHLLASATPINGFRLSAAELAAGRLLRGPDGHDDDDAPAGGNDDDDVLDLTEELQPGDPPEGAEPPEGGDGEEEILTFGDGADEEDGDTNLVKHLRSQIRERDKRLAEVARAPRAEPIVVGEKPTLEGCGFDEDEYDREMEAWRDRRAKKAQQDSAVSEAGEQEKEVWVGEIERYNSAKAKLGFKDIDDAEETVKASLDTVQQAALVMAAEDPAKLVYALGKHPAKLAELAAEKNPLKLAAKIARLEGQLKMVKRKTPPTPDEPERGSGKFSPATADKRLKKLEEEATRTGDRTELIKYRKELKAKAGK